MSTLSLYDLHQILKKMISENYSKEDINYIKESIDKKLALLEDTSATGGPAVANATVSGMGAVVPAAPSSLPGALQGAAWASGGGTIGSGDVSVPYNPSGGNRVFQKLPAQYGVKPKKGKKMNMKQLKDIFAQKQDYISKEKTMNFDDFVKKSMDVVTKVKESSDVNSFEFNNYEDWFNAANSKDCKFEEINNEIKALDKDGNLVGLWFPRENFGKMFL